MRLAMVLKETGGNPPWELYCTNHNPNSHVCQDTKCDIFKKGIGAVALDADGAAWLRNGKFVKAAKCPNVTLRKGEDP
jgi:hypothetical protein